MSTCNNYATMSDLHNKIKHWQKVRHHSNANNRQKHARQPQATMLQQQTVSMQRAQHEQRQRQCIVGAPQRRKHLRWGDGLLHPHPCYTRCRGSHAQKQRHDMHAKVPPWKLGVWRRPWRVLFHMGHRSAVGVMLGDTAQSVWCRHGLRLLGHHKLEALSAKQLSAQHRQRAAHHHVPKQVAVGEVGQPVGHHAAAVGLAPAHEVELQHRLVGHNVVDWESF